MMPRPFLLLALATALVWAMTADARAQQGTPAVGDDGQGEPASREQAARRRPGRQRATNTATLTVNVSASVDPDGAAVADDLTRTAGLNAVFNFTRTDHRVGWRVGATTSARYLPQTGELVAARHGGAVGLALPLGRRTSLVTSGTLTYSPFYTMAWLGSEATALDAADLNAVGLDFAVARRSAYTGRTEVALTRGVGSRASVTMMYGAHRTEYESAEDPDLTSQFVSGRFAYRFAKNASVRLGYGLREGNFGPAGQIEKARVDDLDAGLDFNQSLQVTRGTTIGFTTGSSILSEGRRKNVHLVGSASVNQMLWRFATARLGYDRGVGFRYGLVRPVIADSVSLTVETDARPRLRVIAATAYSVGEIGGDRNGYRTLTGSLRLSYRFMRESSLHAEYLHYAHDVGGAVVLLSGVSRIEQRNSVRVGVTVGVPILTPRVREGR